MQILHESFYGNSEIIFMILKLYNSQLIKIINLYEFLYPENTNNVCIHEPMDESHHIFQLSGSGSIL